MSTNLKEIIRSKGVQPEGNTAEQIRQVKQFLKVAKEREKKIKKQLEDLPKELDEIRIKQTIAEGVLLEDQRKFREAIGLYLDAKTRLTELNSREDSQMAVYIDRAGNKFIESIIDKGCIGDPYSCEVAIESVLPIINCEDKSKKEIQIKKLWADSIMNEKNLYYKYYEAAKLYEEVGSVEKIQGAVDRYVNAKILDELELVLTNMRSDSNSKRNMHIYIEALDKALFTRRETDDEVENYYKKAIQELRPGIVKLQEAMSDMHREVIERNGDMNSVISALQDKNVTARDVWLMVNNQ